MEHLHMYEDIIKINFWVVEFETENSINLVRYEVLLVLTVQCDAI